MKKFSNQELKDRARGQLPGHYKTLVMTEILNMLVGLLASMFFTGGSYLTSLLLSVIISLLLAVLSTGFHYIYLQLARGNTFSTRDLFFCFSHHPDKVIVIELFLYLLTLAVTLPFYIVWYFVSFRHIWAAVLFTLLLLVGWIAAVIAVRIPYLIVYYLYIDYPDWNAVSVLSESRGRMAGQVRSAYRLILSFAGYAFLGIASLGIAFLWISPYVRMSITEFYLERGM